jgi:hypothetical protein
MAGTPPDYDNVRWGGPDGIRVPQEVGKCTLVVKRAIILSAAAATGTVTLQVDQAGASYFSISNTGATTLIFPRLTAHEFVVNNLAASSGTVTVKVLGQTSTPIAVAAGFLQSFIIDPTIGVVPSSAAVAV